ncbi:NADPH-dependent ferric siderophore reductase, contains FAD-binding and SIP domains [Streptomyces sp. cf386]|uniref:siderophore-interacting protein n=1 Tax=Streptomyces sp. cf386 TaxID=1761904 RepID=UPI0008848E17|nr:siderophore-interacting protein [Streptomyces sp. cf386]SDO37007.1 NADPH-dependent ferric siderophore reductase, contains FAD-binding and SIP domains [Streptomyces sp. cf386]
MTTAVAAPFRFFSLQVVRTRRLGPSLVRVSFAGEDLRHFFSDGCDQSLSLFLPHPGQREPQVPLELGDGWWQGWRELPDDVRAVMRSYTLRALRRDAYGHTTEIDIDFVLHGIEPGAAVPAGPASRWASRAAAGDRVLLLGPAIADNRAIRFRPSDDTDLVVIWGDETAVPAVSAILESLPAGTRARVWLEVHDAGDIQDLATEADAEITWLVQDESRAEGSPMALDAIRADRLPAAERPYVWIAGESGCVKTLRRHFVGERGVDRRRVTFVGYWRQGLSEEQLREQE